MKKLCHLRNSDFLLLFSLLLSAVCVSCRWGSAVKDKKNTADIILEEKEPLLNLNEKWEWITGRRQNNNTMHIFNYRYRTPPNKLVSDFLIKTPSMPGIYHKVQEEETVSKLSELYHVPTEIIMEANNLANDSVNTDYLFIPNPYLKENFPDTGLLEESFIYPVQGDITRSFGWQRDSNTYIFHPGVDIKAEAGTVVRAAMSGIAYDTGISPLYGKYIILRHNRNFFSFYSRLSEVNIKEGYVRQGCIIGKITGNDDDPDLFFGIFKNNNSLNPAGVITGNKKLKRLQK